MLGSIRQVLAIKKAVASKSVSSFSETLPFDATQVAYEMEVEETPCETPAPPLNRSLVEAFADVQDPGLSSQTYTHGIPLENKRVN